MAFFIADGDSSRALFKVPGLQQALNRQRPLGSHQLRMPYEYGFTALVFNSIRFYRRKAANGSHIDIRKGFLNIKVILVHR